MGIFRENQFFWVLQVLNGKGNPEGWIGAQGWNKVPEP